MSLNPLSVSTLAAGAALWVFSLISVLRGRGMNRVQRALTAAILLAAPVGVYLVVR